MHAECIVENKRGMDLEKECKRRRNCNESLIPIVLAIEAAVKYNGRKKLHHARIYYSRLVYFYIRLLYYDHNTTGWCNMIIIQQPDVKVHQQCAGWCKIVKSEKKL